MRFPSFLQRSGSSSGRVRRNLAHTFGIGALVALLMASGVGVTFALWNSQAEATSSISGAKLELTTTFADLDFTFANHSLSTTGTFTVTNTTETNSNLAGTVSAQLSAPGDAALASALNVAVWPRTVAACTVASAPGTATNGTWSSIAPITTSLTPGSSATFCVRVTGVERGVMGDGDGAMSITPTVSAKLTMGNWNSVAVTSSATQTTNAIYPATAPSTGTWQQIVNRQTLDCVDVHGNTTASGTGVIDYPCKWGTDSTTYNQQWQFSVAASVSGGTYYAMTPRHSTGLRMGVDGNSANSLAEAKVLTNSTTAHSQQWQPQYRSAGVFQLVNRNSGLCLTPHNTATYGDLEYVQTPCDSARADQTFSAYTPFPVPTMTLTCGNAAGGGLTYTWTGGTIGGVVEFTATPDGGAATAIGSAVYSTGSFTVMPGQLAADGRHVLSAAGGATALANVPFWRTTANGSSALSCTAPIPVIDTMNCVDGTGTGTARTVVCTISPAPTGTYTVQAATVANTGISWTNVASSANGELVISSSGIDALPVGNYNIRVVDSAGNVLNSAWRITVGSAQYCSGVEFFGCWGGSGWVNYVYPSSPAASTPTFSCFNTGSNNNRRVSYAWDLQYPGELTFQVVRNGSSTTMATAPPLSTAQAVTWTPPNAWSTGTYTVNVLHGATPVGATQVSVASGTGNNKILRCVT